MKFLPQVTLLSTPSIPIFVDFKILDQDLQQLRYYMRSYEIWGTGVVDQQIFKAVTKTLTQLCDFLYSPSEASRDADSWEVRDGKIKDYRTKGAGRSRSASLVDDQAMSSGKPPSEIFKGQPNKHHQSLCRNMGMVRQPRPVPSE